MSSSVTTEPVKTCTATERLAISPSPSTVAPFTIPEHQVMPFHPKGSAEPVPS
jgi:hypothetical protein